MPKTPEEATRFVQEQLNHSRLYIHLVGYNPGSTPTGFSQPLPALQKQLADQSQHPCLLWRLPDVDPADIDDDDQRQLAEQARAGDIEACRRAIQDRLDELARAETFALPPEAAEPGETLFVNHLPDDEDLARSVCQTLASHQYMCVKRSFDGATEQELREDFEENLRSCDSLLMVYGKASKVAAKRQVMDCVKVVASRQPTGRTIGAWFVVAGPPAKPNTSLDLFIEGLHEVDCSRDLEMPLVGALAEHRKGGER